MKYSIEKSKFKKDVQKILKSGWRKKFALFPTRLNGFDYIWLEFVEQKDLGISYFTSREVKPVRKFESEQDFINCYPIFTSLKDFEFNKSKFYVICEALVKKSLFGIEYYGWAKFIEKSGFDTYSHTLEAVETLNNESNKEINDYKDFRITKNCIIKSD